MLWILQKKGEVTIDANHRRALQSGLLMIERNLHQMKDDLERTDGSSFVLYSIINDVDPKSRTRILNLIPSILDEIRQIREEFGLDADRVSAKRRIYTALSEIWVNLEDSRPEKLEAYGHMSRNDRERLRPRILRLLEMQDDLYKALESN